MKSPLKTINNPIDYTELTSRIKLLPGTPARKWGKMTVAQMLVHCTTQLRIALGELPAQSQGLWIMRTSLGKKIGLGNMPWPKGSATPQEMNVDRNTFTPAEFDTEKSRLLKYLESARSAESLKPHPFFGPLSKQEWARLIYKHVDHHLKQFSQ
jgi:hypothetical protein